jgi:hypothetical protein
MNDTIEQENKSIQERHPNIRELDPEDMSVKKREIDQADNAYVLNRNNPDWPLAVKLAASRKRIRLVSNKQIRGIRYGE